MTTITKPIVHTQQEHTGAGLQTYVTGFILSVALSIVAYLLTTHHSLTGKGMMALLLGLAVVQFVVQLFFFLHIGSETKPRWKLLMLFLMLVFVLIVVLGSLWVMYNLNYRMSPEQMSKYMLEQTNSGL